MGTETKGRAHHIIDKFGGQSALAKLIGRRQSTVQHWAKAGVIPARWQARLLELAAANGVELAPADFMSAPVANEIMPAGDALAEETDLVSPSPEVLASLPKARLPGMLQILDLELPCYVLDNGMRIIAQRAAVKVIAGVETGKTGDYLAVQAIKPYLNNDLREGETVLFAIPGQPRIARGISAETFLDICNAYARAFKNNDLTERQQRTAINCSIFSAACAKLGLIALIDEATGYQFERPDDALQVKLKAFLEKEMRKWEKTFPDELWMEFGRLTGWKGAIHARPKYWGKLVIELVYEYLDKDVADWLRANAPAPRHGQNYHQWLSSQYGLKKLVEHIYMLIGIAKTCRGMPELRERMAEHFGKTMVQIRIPYALPPRS